MSTSQFPGYIIYHFFCLKKGISKATIYETNSPRGREITELGSTTSPNKSFAIHRICMLKKPLVNLPTVLYFGDIT